MNILTCINYYLEALEKFFPALFTDKLAGHESITDVAALGIAEYLHQRVCVQGQNALHKLKAKCTCQHVELTIRE